MTQAPRVDPVQLGELRNSDGIQLTAGGSAEGERYTRLELRGKDLTDASFSGCEFLGVSLTETVLRGTSFLETRLVNLNAPLLSAARSRWRDVVMTQSRIGAGELYETEWSGVVISNSRLGYVNLRGARLLDVLISDCRIDELDFGQVHASRVAIRDCQIGALVATGARFQDVDLRGSEFAKLDGVNGLRGATIDDTQLVSFAPLLAANAGILVE